MVEIDATRVGSEAAQIAEEVIAHLNCLLNARFKITLEIEVDNWFSCIHKKTDGETFGACYNSN